VNITAEQALGTQEAVLVNRNTFEVPDPSGKKEPIRVVYASFAACIERKANEMQDQLRALKSAPASPSRETALEKALADSMPLLEAHAKHVLGANSDPNDSAVIHAASRALKPAPASQDAAPVEQVGWFITIHGKLHFVPGDTDPRDVHDNGKPVYRALAARSSAKPGEA
jgi:hypothetical protein